MYIKKIRNRTIATALLGCIVLNNAIPASANVLKNSNINISKSTLSEDINYNQTDKGKVAKKNKASSKKAASATSSNGRNAWEGLNIDDYWERNGYGMNSFSLNENDDNQTQFFDVIEGYDNSIVAVGEYEEVHDTSNMVYHGLIAKFDKDTMDNLGYKIIESSRSNYEFNISKIVKSIDDDGFIVIGLERNNQGYTNRDSYIIKLDRDLNVVKRVAFSPSNMNFLDNILVVDDTYVLSGLGRQPYTTGAKNYLLKYDKDLNLLKSTALSDFSNVEDGFVHYNEVDGHIYYACYKTLFKIDKNFNVIKRFTSTGMLSDLTSDSNGNILVVNRIPAGEHYDYTLQKYDGEFNLLADFLITNHYTGNYPVLTINDGYLVGDYITKDIIKLNGDLEKVDAYNFPFNLDSYNINPLDPEHLLFNNGFELLSDGTVAFVGYFYNDLNGIEHIRYHTYGVYSAVIGRLDTNTMTITGNEPYIKGYSSGDGTKENPFIINNAEDLSKVSAHTALGVVDIKDSFKLVSDIDLKDYDVDNDTSNGNFRVIGDSYLGFVGNFDGGNHTISNLSIKDESESYLGLFGYVYEGNIRNLTLKNVNMASDYGTSALVGFCDSTIIDNVKVLDATLVGDTAVGAITGESYDLIVSNVLVENPKINAEYSAGGLFGEASGNYKTNIFTNCIVKNLNLNSIEGDAIGGLAGISHMSMFENCHASGEINIDNVGTWAYIGGLIGDSENYDYLDYVVSNSSSAVNINVAGNVEIALGGLIGSHDSNGEIETKVINNSNYTGAITADGRISYIGGLIGCSYSGGTVYNSYSNATINAPDSEYIGGLIGFASEIGKIEKSYAIGNIDAQSIVGGLIGGSKHGVNIKDAYADLTLTGKKDVGGLIGNAEMAVLNLEDAYSGVNIIKKNNSSNIGPIIGALDLNNLKTHNVKDIYYDREKTDSSEVHGFNIIGLNTSQMIGRATYDNMDFDYQDVWYIRGTNYPIFKYTNTPPVVNEYTVEVLQGSDFKAEDYAVVSDLESAVEDLVVNVLRDEVDTSVVGNHEVEYEVIDEGGLSDTGIVTVKVLKDLSPIINAFDKIVYLGNDFYPLEGVTAEDKEDGDITKDLNVDYTELDMSTEGEYKVIYEVTDSAGNTTIKEIKVTVIQGDVNVPTIDYDNAFVTIEEKGTNIPLIETEDFEDEDLKLAFNNSEWKVENGVMKSPEISDDESTENILTFNSDKKSTMYIDVKMSSENGYDKGFIYLNDNMVGTYSGEMTKTVELKLNEGINTIKFEYSKDSSDYDGDDCMYIEAIRYTNGTKPVDSLSYRVNGSEWNLYNDPFKLEGYEIGDEVLVEAKATAEGTDSDIRKKYIVIGGNRRPELFVDDNIKIEIDKDFNYKDYVKAEDFEDGDITDDVIMKGDLNTGEEGEYEVSFEVTDSGGLTVDKTVTITVVVPNRIPVIHASDLEIVLNSEFDAKDHATATDEEDGDITDRIVVVKDTVVPSVKGEYEVTYQVTDNDGVTVSKTIKVSVVESLDIIPPDNGGDDNQPDNGGDDNQPDNGGDGNKPDNSGSDNNQSVVKNAPVINVVDKTITVGDKFKPLQGVTASDKEDGDLTKNIIVISNNVDTSKVGEYSVTYEVSDSDNNVTTKTIKVVVKEKVVNDTDNTNKPQTGDNMLIYYALTLSSLLGLIVLNKKDRFKNKINK